MDLSALLDALGEDRVAALFGLATGIVFGVAAQRSSFCLRAATVEFARGILGRRMAVWLLTFSTAVVWVQGAQLLGLFRAEDARMMAIAGSWSGAIIGGLMFGSGMTLTRACASRMLVLSATGNLRALLSGLVFAVVAQAALIGALSPARAWVNGLWTIDSGARDLLALLHMGNSGGALFAALWLVAGVVLARRARLSVWSWIGGAGVGLMVAAAWWFNYAMAATSFEVVAVHSLSFTSPSAEALMYLLSPPGAALSFDLGLIPGVVVGAFVAGALGGDLRLEGFDGGASMRRYIAGGCLMGFGGVLAGGCAVGAGVSGASVFALTAWIVLWSMWVGAVVTDRLVDRDRGRSEFAGDAS